MAKRKRATRSDGRRAPSGSASKSGRAGAKAAARKAAARKSTARKSASRKAVSRKAVSRKAAPADRRKARPAAQVTPLAAPASQPRRAAAPAVMDSPSPAVPSSLNLDRRPSAARTGRAELAHRYRNHHETDPRMTAGDIDADWEAAYSVGDEAPGGDNPTPGQTVVEDVGRALGVEYDDEEELKAADKIEKRDRHRWELDPASSEDYQERVKRPGRRRTPR